MRRLFPAAFVTLVLTAIFGFLLLSPEHFRDMGGSMVYAIVSLSNFYFWYSAGYFDTANHFKPLLHTWSLSVEEQFYLVWPAILLVAYRFWALPFAVLALGLGSFCLTVFYTADPATIFYLMPFRIFELAIGGALNFLPSRKPPNLVLEAANLVGLAAIVYAVPTFSGDTVFPNAAALIPCLGTAAALYAGEARYSGLLLRNPLSVWIGLISYSLYLVHWPIIVFYRYYLFSDFGTMQKLSICIGAVALASILYWFVERPYRRPARPISKAAFGLACAAFSAVLLIPAASVWANGGWWWRVNIPEGDIAAFVKVGGGEGLFHHRNYGGANCAQPDCRSSPFSPAFAVIGDSHGRMYYEGLKRFADPRKISFRVFENGGCNFVSSRDKCPAKTLAANYLASGEVDTAFLAQAWIRDSYAKKFFNAPAKIPRQYVVYYMAHLKRDLTVGYLKDLKRLIVVGQVPQFAGFGDTMTCMTKPTYLTAPVPCANADIASHPNLIFRREFNRQMKDAVAGLSIPGKTITFLDPFDVLCNEAQCRQIIKGHLVYSDDDHLSKYGSMLVVGAFRRQLQEMLDDTKTGVPAL